jgi:gliding motility-associated-like protein
MNVTLGTCPLALDDSTTTPENTPVDVYVLINDYYCVKENGQETVEIVREPMHGIAMDGDQLGWVDYYPDYGFYGKDSLLYRLGDFSDEYDTATVYINVLHVNHPPVAIDDSASTVVNLPVIIDILANDYDPDGDAITPTIIIEPAHGTVFILPDYTIKYSPEYYYEGYDTLYYKICDNGDPVMCDSAMVVIYIYGESIDAYPLIIYNALTPNYDNCNDYWKIKGIERFPDNNVYIMDRWGRIIFEGKGYNNGSVRWEGTDKNGNMLPNNTYYYILELKREDMLFKGWVFLIK